MPTTVSELLAAATIALQDRDEERLTDLRNHASNWMQCDEEWEAQRDLLDAMIEVAEEEVFG